MKMGRKEKVGERISRRVADYQIEYEMLFSGLVDTDGRNMKEVIQIEATECLKKPNTHTQKPNRTCQKHRHKRIATVSLPEDKELLEAHLKHNNTCTHFEEKSILQSPFT